MFFTFVVPVENAVGAQALTVTEANTTVGATGRRLPPTNATTYHWELPGVEHTFIGGWERYDAVAGAVAVDATTADLHGDFGNEEAPALAAYVARAFDRPVVRAPRVAGGRVALRFDRATDEGGGRRARSRRARWAAALRPSDWRRLLGRVG